MMYLHLITDSHNSCTLGMTTKDIADDDFGDHYKNDEREHVKLVITGLDSIMICMCSLMYDEIITCILISMTKMIIMTAGRMTMTTTTTTMMMMITIGRWLAAGLMIYAV